MRYIVSPNETSDKSVDENEASLDPRVDRSVYGRRRREGAGAPERLLVPRAAAVARRSGEADRHSRARPPSACCRRSSSPGFLAKEHGAYQLGIKCFVLGNIVAGGLDLRETAHPHLVALRDATRETTQIAILDHWQVVYLERMLSPLPVGFMRTRAGAILPAYCTGLGKTLLAFMPEAEVAAWAATQRFPADHAANDHLGEAPAEGTARDPRARVRARRRGAGKGRVLRLPRRSGTTTARWSRRSAWRGRASACRRSSRAARWRRRS